MLRGARRRRPLAVRCVSALKLIRRLLVHAVSAPAPAPPGAAGSHPALLPVAVRARAVPSPPAGLLAAAVVTVAAAAARAKPPKIRRGPGCFGGRLALAGRRGDGPRTRRCMDGARMGGMRGGLGRACTLRP